MMEIFYQLIAAACALLVSLRVVSVLNQLSFRDRARHYVRWLAFGMSYAAFMVAAIGSAIHVWQGLATAGDWVWLLAAAGMVVFDRRHCRERPTGYMHA